MRVRGLTVSISLAALLALVTLVGASLWRSDQSSADRGDAAQVSAGRAFYAKHCASCHGAHLEGQPNWRERLPNGRLPAPPHDASGHTWHHADAVLFALTKEGLVPGRYAPPGYQSDMPGFKGVLTDSEIWAVLAYIKSTWPPEILARQQEVDRQHRSRR